MKYEEKKPEDKIPEEYRECVSVDLYCGHYQDCVNVITYFRKERIELFDINFMIREVSVSDKLYMASAQVMAKSIKHAESRIKFLLVDLLIKKKEGVE